MKVIRVLRQRTYAAIAVVSSLLLSFVYIYTQVLGNLNNLDLWFAIIPWYNAILFVIFAALFGITLAFQVHNWRQPKVCNVKGGAGASGAATFTGFLVAQCPACASLGALLLPASIFHVFVIFSPVINIISIALLLFTIHYLSGFKK